MIGQKDLMARLYTLIHSGIYPRFSILEGDRGSGRLTMALEISKQLDATPIIVEDLSIASVREIIQKSYTNSAKCCYIFPNADTMSTAAKNSMLKVTEEAPNNAYIIMTLEDKQNTLNTIISRATVFNMDPYSKKELSEFVEEVGIEKDVELLLTLSNTPGEILRLNDIGVAEFGEYVKKVYDNIALVSGSNSFKIASKVSLKDGAEGYPLDLFWKAFIKECANEMLDNINDKYYTQKTSYGIRTTSDALADLKIKGINKKMLMDNWILTIREGWME